MSSPAERRWTRPLAATGIILLTLLVGILALLQLPPVATWVVRRLVTVVPLNPGYRLEVGRVSGDWLHRLVLDEVRLIRDDRQLARVDRLKVGYDPRHLRGVAPRIRELTVEGARAVARREGDNWDLASALRRSADTTGSGGGFTVERLDLRDVELVAELAPDSALRVRGLNLHARDLVIGPQVLVQVDQLNAAVAPPGSGRWFAVATRGAATRDEFRFNPVRIQTEQSHVAGWVVLPRRLDDLRLVDRLDLGVKTMPLALADLAAVVPVVTPEGDLRLEARAEGNAAGLVTARLGARLDEATLRLSGAAAIAKGAVDYRLNGTIRRLDPSRLYKAGPSGSLNGKVEADLKGSTLARADGRVDFRLTPSRLAGTALDRLDLHADVRGGSAAVRLRGVAGGGALAVSGQMRPFDSVPEYRLTGAASGLPGSDAIARALAGESGEPVLDVRFHLAGAGISPTSARLTGGVELTAWRRDGDSVPLGHSTLALAGGRLEARPELLVAGGRITADAIARLGDTVTYEVKRGAIDRVDLGRLLADTTMAPLSGQFSLSGRGVSPAGAVVAARVELDEVRYGARQVEEVSGLARLDHGRARIDFRGALQGGRLALHADARPFDATAAFNLRRASIERVDLGTFLGRPDLAGPVTLHVSGGGRWRGAARSLQARVTVAPSRLGRVELTTGSLDVKVRGERLTYDGSVDSKAGALALAGEGRPFAEEPSFAVHRGRADSLDLGTLLGRPDLRTGVNARFTGAVTGGSADSLQGRLAVELLPSSINQAQLTGGRLGLELERGAVRGELRLASPDGELGARLNGRLGDTRQVHTDGTLRLERLARWTGRPDADGRLESRFILDAAGDSTGLISLGGTIDAIGGIGGVHVQTVHLSLRPEFGAIQVDTMFIRSNVAALDGGGRIALREGAVADTLRLTGTAADVAPLAALAGADSVTLDSARVALTVSGPAGHWRVDGKADIHGILSAGNLAELLTVEAGATLDSTRLGAAAGELRVENAAYGTVRIPEARFAARYDSLVSLEANVAVGDSVRLTAGLRGSASGDTVRAVLQRLDLTEGGRNWSLEQPADLMLRPQLVVDGLGLRAGSHRITLNGTFDRRGSSDIALRLTDVDLDVLRDVRLAPIGGRLDGWLRLAGPSVEPMLEGSLGLTIRRRKGSEVGRIRTDLTWTREGLRLNATAAPQKGGRLTVNGTLPWRLTLVPADTAAVIGTLPALADTVALAVRADSFDLGLFEPLLSPETARELRGRLVADARVTGTPQAPRADGTLRVTGVGVTVPALDLSYGGGELIGTMVGDELRIERLWVRTGKKESVTAQGMILLRPLTNPKLDLTAELRKFRISNSATLKSMATGQVRLQGTVAAPTLSGALTLGRTDIIVGAAQGAATVEKVELMPQDLRQLARTFGPAALARANKSPGLVDRFHLDLNLRLPRQVWFRKRGTPKADIELSGRIRLRQEPGQPMQFFGRVEPVPGRGSLDVYGREFRLTGGEVTLAGPTDSTRLDVAAQYQVPTQGGLDDEAVLINVAAKGHPDSLSLKFTGDPEMSQDDMLSYIVTGAPSSNNPLADQSTGQQSAGDTGAEVALSGLTQNLSDIAGRELGMDVFQIRQEGLYGLTLTAGRYVGSRAFLSLLLPIQVGTNPQQTPGYNLGPGFELEYTMRRWLRGTVRGGSVPPQFTLRSRYAY
jgi:translocation and assembly module TamB